MGYVLVILYILSDRYEPTNMGHDQWMFKGYDAWNMNDIFLFIYIYIINI